MGRVMTSTMEPATAYKRNTIQMGLAWCRDLLAMRDDDGRLMPGGCRASNLRRRALPQRQSGGRPVSRRADLPRIAAAERSEGCDLLSSIDGPALARAARCPAG